MRYPCSGVPQVECWWWRRREEGNIGEPSSWVCQVKCWWWRRREGNIWEPSSWVCEVECHCGRGLIGKGWTRRERWKSWEWEWKWRWGIRDWKWWEREGDRREWRQLRNRQFRDWSPGESIWWEIREKKLWGVQCICRFLLLVPAQGSVHLLRPVAQCAQAEYTEVLLFRLDWYFIRCDPQPRSIAGARGAPDQTHLTHGNNFFTVHTVDPIHTRYLQLINSIVICCSVDGKVDRFGGFGCTCFEFTLDVHIHAWLHRKHRIQTPKIPRWIFRNTWRVKLSEYSGLRYLARSSCTWRIC